MTVKILYNKKQKLKTSKQNNIFKQHKKFAKNWWKVGVRLRSVVNYKQVWKKHPGKDQKRK